MIDESTCVENYRVIADMIFDAVDGRIASVIRSAIFFLLERSHYVEMPN